MAVGCWSRLAIQNLGSGGANPTALAGPVAINGVALSFMRSDAAPAVQLGTSAQAGIVQVDGSTITAVGGVITATAGVPPTSASPSATAGPVAVNGSAATFMRSDAAPAVQKASASQFGIVEVDGTSITATGGVISATGSSGANPSATAGPAAINGVATTFMRSDAAPAVQKASAAQFGIVEVDGTTVTAAAGVISTPGGHNPTATAGPVAVNGSAYTFMRSDGAPAIQKATNAAFGIVEGDGTTITCVAGVASVLSTAALTVASITFGSGTPLNDYEEGIWTPTDASGVGLVFTGVTCLYRRIGKLIFIAMNITYPTTADGTNAAVGGLPYTVATGVSASGGGATGVVASGLFWLASGGGITITFYSTAGVQLKNSDLSTKQIAGTTTYSKI
jgi:hypothetical protein